jgi:hypothetical protein
MDKINASPQNDLRGGKTNKLKTGFSPKPATPNGKGLDLKH